MTQFVQLGGAATGEIRGILIKSILKQAEAIVAELVTSSRASWRRWRTDGGRLSRRLHLPPTRTTSTSSWNYRCFQLEPEMDAMTV